MDKKMLGKFKLAGRDGDKLVKQVFRTLRAARGRIATPSSWCTTFLGRDADGKYISFDAIGCASWCAMGAVLAESGYDYMIEAASLKLLKEAAAIDCLASWNDRSTHSEVLAAFDKAIARELGG